MYERFGDQSRRALTAAEQEARTLGHVVIGTGELLLGLLSDPDGSSSQVLQGLGVDLDVARRGLAAVASDDVSEATGPPLTTQAKRTVQRADRIARLLGDRTIQPEHLLLSLLAATGGTAAQVVQRAGTTVDDIRDRILATMDLVSVDVSPDRGVGASAPATARRPGRASALRPAAPPRNELDHQAWQLLRWRQDHLPLERVRRPADWLALQHLEQRAATRIVSRLKLEERHGYCLVAYHQLEVELLAAQAAPDRWASWTTHELAPGPDGAAPGEKTWRRRHTPTALSKFGTWASHRKIDIHDLRFALATRHSYRGAPKLAP
jgi:Clp amino terminal domain, pathogenicity island component